MLAAAREADRAPPLDGDALEAARADEDAARTRLEDYRSLETALSAADGAAGRLARRSLLGNRDLDEASMERFAEAARGAAIAFGILAGEARAAGETALAADAEDRASGLGLDERLWAWKLADRRFAAAVRAEREMAPPRTAGEVRSWRDLRERQAGAREEGAAIAAEVAEAARPEYVGTADEWRGRAAQCREQAGRIRGALPALEELETVAAAAETAPQDEAAWNAAADAAERILEGSGRGFGEEAERACAEEARRRQQRREAVRERFDALTAEWDAFDKGERREGRAVFAHRGSRPYVARARELEADPDLDAEAKKKVDRFLREHDDVRPEVVRRTRQLFSQWNGVREVARSRGVGRFIPPQSAAVVEGMRRLAAEHPDHLSRKQREMFETVAAEYDLFVDRQRQWVMTMRP